MVKAIEFHPPLSHVGSASPHILHHRPTFNIVQPVERSVDLLRQRPSRLGSEEESSCLQPMRVKTEELGCVLVPHAFYDKVLTERTASRNVYYILFIQTLNP